MTFLIVDDSQPFRNSVSRYIQSRIPDHHKIYEATDGGEAVTMYEDVRPDWVLMDIAMEPMDGLTGSREILCKHPKAKIIILTNYDDADYRSAAKDAGASAYVLKDHLNEIPSIVSALRNGSIQ